MVCRFGEAMLDVRIESSAVLRGAWVAVAGIPAEAAELHRAAGGDGVGRGEVAVADLEDVRSGEGDGHGDSAVLIVVRGGQQVRHAAAPAAGVGLVRQGGLPLGLLVAVGEKLGRARHAVRAVLDLG